MNLIDNQNLIVKLRANTANESQWTANHNTNAVTAAKQGKHHNTCSLNKALNNDNRRTAQHN